MIMSFWSKIHFGGFATAIKHNKHSFCAILGEYISLGKNVNKYLPRLCLPSGLLLLSLLLKSTYAQLLKQLYIMLFVFNFFFLLSFLEGSLKMDISLILGRKSETYFFFFFNSRERKQISFYRIASCGE